MLELQGEPGTKVEVLAVRGKPEDEERPVRGELMLKSLRLSHSSFHGLRRLVLTDVALEAVHRTGGSISDSPPEISFGPYVMESVTIQRSLLIPMSMIFSAGNVTIVDSAIMVQAPRRGFSQDVSASTGLTLVNSTLANSSFISNNMTIIVNSSMHGKYTLRIVGDGTQSRIEKSHFGACHGYCMSATAFTTTESYLTMVGSSMQTAVACLGIGWHVEMRDMEIFDVHTPFIDYLPLSDSADEAGIR